MDTDVVCVYSVCVCVCTHTSTLFIPQYNYYLAIKNKTLSFSITWMSLEDYYATSNKSQRDKYHIVSPIRGI